ncbi:hypothetical protein Nepgr_026675 [Nepenthes gracilis]|uniref:Uncharacterized protein n=1 Tax=Nepenthes gracilis TaxID=150966 RepID=A0AAD3T8N2_NEPGR|nr:hypothetical protein Nepgr_026675 [Nepenthes gracilis]
MFDSLVLPCSNLVCCITASGILFIFGGSAARPCAYGSYVVLDEQPSSFLMLVGLFFMFMDAVKGGRAPPPLVPPHLPFAVSVDAEVLIAAGVWSLASPLVGRLRCYAPFSFWLLLLMF